MLKPFPFHRATLATLVIGVSLGIGLDAGAVSAINFGRRFHHWGRFRPGSWTVVRQGCETLDAGGRVVSNTTSETKTVLTGVDDLAMTLRVESSVEVAGKTLDGVPQELREGLLGERPNAAVYTDMGEEAVTVEGVAYNCQVQQTESNAGGKRTVTTTWFAPQVAPFVLRKQTKTLDPQTSAVLSEMSMEVTRLSVPRRILARMRSVAEVRIVQQHPRGQTRSVAFTSPEIPGGIVSQTTEEFDLAGKLLRRTKAELVDFEKK